MSGRNSKFIRNALPFFSLVIGGAWVLHYFQQVRYDFRKIQKADDNTENLKSDLSKSGVRVRDNVTIDSVLKEVVQLDTDNWENIRGPRDTEDLTNYNRIKRSQQETSAAAREQKFRALAHGNLRGDHDDAGDNPPEPIAAPLTPASSIRAIRGSPTPSTASGQILDPIPDPFSLPVSFALPPTSSTVSVRGEGSTCSDAFSGPSSISALPPSIPDYRVLGTSQPSEPGASSAATRGSSERSLQSPGAPGAHPSDPVGVQADPSHLASLIDLGFEEPIARIALVRTANHGVEAAVQWIVERSNESDFEDDSDDGGEETEGEGGEGAAEEMGGAQSVPAAVAASLARAAAGERTHKMILVANTSLKMGVGKLAAQVGHATLAVYRAASATEEGRAALEAWKRHGEVKIVVKGESTEQLMDLFKTAKDAGLFAYIIQDAGYTQIPPGSRTVLGVFGPVEVVDSVTKHLKLL